MAQDHDDDIRPAAEAPDAWTEPMIHAALDAGIAIETPAGPSITKALKRAAERIGAWADDPALGKDVLRLLERGQIMLDAPLFRATLSPGAELAVSAALLHWPTQRSDELEAIARAQTLLAAGAKLGIAGAPSSAALDALDAAARLADPIGRDGASILVRPNIDAAPEIIAATTARARAGAALAAGARALDAALAELAIEAVRNGMNIENGGVQRKAATARLTGAPDADIIAALAGAVARIAVSQSPHRKRAATPSPRSPTAPSTPPAPFAPTPNAASSARRSRCRASWASASSTSQRLSPPFARSCARSTLRTGAQARRAVRS
jgi:ribonucleoside-diphosphate reductase alpha chain